MWNKNLLEKDAGLFANGLDNIELPGPDVSRMPASFTPMWWWWWLLLLLYPSHCSNSNEIPDTVPSALGSHNHQCPACESLGRTYPYPTWNIKLVPVVSDQFLPSQSAVPCG